MKPVRKICAAVTGGIGSGKSFFCKMLEEKGFPVIYADNLSKDILEKDLKVREQVIAEFGEEAFKNGQPDKKYLAEKVFNNPEKLFILNAILHPVVIKKQNEMIIELFKKHDIVFVEAALIYEAELEEYFDYIILITADDNIKMERKIATGLSKDDFLKRADNQIPDSEKMNRADFSFINNGSPEDLKNKADLLITLLNTLKFTDPEAD